MPPIDLSIIVVNYNTRDLTAACLQSVYAQTEGYTFELIVVDNDSNDGSATAIRERFPEARLIEPKANLGFARANNLAAAQARGQRLLLLNSDTVVLDGAIQKLLAFADVQAEAGIFGGRTVFADGTLNPTSCWARPTLWSNLCAALGLTALGANTSWLNPEAIGGWARNDTRCVDIISGCFLMIDRDLWQRLDGFDPRFFMYGEDADMCLRARAIGARARICPEAQIIHYGGASETVQSDKLVRLFTARSQLMHRHWRAGAWRLGIALHQARALTRAAAYAAAGALGKPSARQKAMTWWGVWCRRGEWARPHLTARADTPPPSNSVSQHVGAATPVTNTGPNTIGHHDQSA